MPVGVPSGYASVIQVCSSGKAALIPNAIRITHPAMEPSRLIGPNSIEPVSWASMSAPDSSRTPESTCMTK